MPALSSFKINVPTLPSIPNINQYRPRRKQPKQQKSTTTPFGIKRVISPGSPHPYASDQVFHITESKSQRSDQSLDFEAPSFEEDVESEPPFSPFQLMVSPKMKLELEVSPEHLGIPAHLLSSDSEVYSEIAASVRSPEASGSGQSRADPLPIPSRSEDGDEESVYEDETGSSVSEDIGANLEAMQASDFVHSNEPVDDLANIQNHKAKKAAPAPIKIPNLNLTRPKVQLVRSSSASYISHTPRSRPASLISLDEPSASAVSGRTLARALIGNSFILSSERRVSKYRSGASNLTRSDSATLPHGEHPLINSPFMRERTLSATSDVFSPGSKRGSVVPPVPPIPHPYSPPTRTASPRPETPAHQSENKAPKTIESVLSSPPSANFGEEDLADPEPMNITFKRSRVSRISEANSSELSTPATNTKSSGGSSQSLVPPPLTLDPPPEPNEDSRPTSQGVSPESLNPPPSTSRSSGSLENVLDYYQLEPSPGLVPPPPPPLPPIAEGGFKPVFTPITEESASQLTPPTPFRESPRSGHKIILGMSPSPSSAAGRIDFGPSRRQSRPDGPLLPIGGRPRPPSAQFATLPTTNPLKPGSVITSLAAMDDLAGPLAPPPISTIFNRQRAGSAPSPIQVVRDEHDHNTYNLTITPGANSSVESSPTTEGVQYATQTFPETPSVFSPEYTPGSMASPVMPLGDNQMPAIPRSAGLPGRVPSLAQQMLLTRAATSVRHSRQNSLGRSRPAAQQLYDSIAEHTNEVDDDDVSLETSDEVVARDVLIANSPNAAAQLFPDAPDTPPVPPPSEPPSSPSLYSGTNGQGPAMVVYPPSHPTRSRSASSSQKSLLLKDKDLPQLPPASPAPSVPRTPGHIPVPPKPTESPPLPPPLPLQRPQTPPHPRTPPQRSRTPPQTFHAPAVPQLPIVPPVQTPTPAITPTETDTPSALDAAVVVTPPAALPPSPRSTSSHNHNQQHVERDMGSPSFQRSFPGSPPPYEAVFHLEQYATTATLTPTSGARSAMDSQFQLSPAFSPGSPMSRDTDRRDMNRASSGRRGRMRPPLPAGPRRPSNQFEHGRARNGSVTSLSSSNHPGSRRALSSLSASLQSPRFQAPTVRWRGYTMDAAKWTFSSSQLQNIVSRAIKQSAEATSIRLLRLETLDNDIPDEMQRLDVQRKDAKAKYKTLSRRRGEILCQLYSHVDGTKPEDSAVAIRLVEELGECSSTLDKLAEDLHSTDEQIAQLNSLREVHSASALAMALRKLNASFLKQLAETKTLREQVAIREAERDEAWKHAESLANEYDHLHEKTQAEPVETLSKRSSRVIASRKSSIRVSKAGLRSARSSMSSIRVSSIPSGAKSAFSVEDIPPVPPIPRRRPIDIVTDLPSRSSAGMSADGFTPNSETRAMIRAHEELCEMLGITVSENRGRRTRSFVVPSRDDSESSALAIPRNDSRPRSNMSTRPSSLPGSARLSEVYDSVMDADRHAMLATFEMLSD